MTDQNHNDSSDDTSLVRPERGGTAVERVGFGTTETALQRETQGTALAARAQAEVQARFIMAERKPRNVLQVRLRILEHCKRPGFAWLAEYAKPVGGQKITGPSIRFVETALQEYGNVVPEETITYDDDYRRIVRMSVTDLERNITYYGDTTVEKTVERKKTKNGDEILGSRTNSSGETVYKIKATEDDFANKIASANSKKLRNLGLRILPADIVAEAMHVCKVTREDEDAIDPKAALRKLSDAFAELRVMPSDLDAYLGHSFAQASPAEMDELRAAYLTVRDGEARWSDLVEAQRSSRGEVEKVSKPAEAATSKVKDRLTKLRESAKAGNGANGTRPAEQPATEKDAG